MTLLVVLTLLLLAVTGTTPQPPDAPPPEEIALVRERLGPLQLVSFATDREYCGYLVRFEDGRLGFTDMVRGGHDGCTPLLPLTGMSAVASVHTHGAYNASVPAEFPTVLDMQSDRRERVNGYIATPGGRLWFIDSRRQIARQLCGLGCLPQDPDFKPGDDGEIAEVYSLRDLKRIEGD